MPFVIVQHDLRWLRQKAVKEFRQGQKRDNPAVN